MGLWRAVRTVNEEESIEMPLDVITAQANLKHSAKLLLVRQRPDGTPS